MKKFFAFLLIFFFIFSYIFVSGVSAVTASPQIIETTQPDGTKIKIRIRGDEFYHWTEDADGYTIMQDNAKYWTYAQKGNFGELKPSENIVGKVSPKTLNIKKSLRDEDKLSRALNKRKELLSLQEKTLLNYSPRLNSEKSASKSSSDDKSVQKTVPPTGTKTNFVLLVQFNDLKFTDNPPFTAYSDDDTGHKAVMTAFNNLFNTTGYSADSAAGSVKDYFKEVSYGALEYNSVISPIITINQNHAYYSDANDNAVGSRTGALIKAALEKFHSDYPTYLRDHVWPNTAVTEPEGFTVIHAGGGAEAGNTAKFIWSHAQYFQYSVGNTVNIEGITFNRYHTEAAGRGYYGNEGITRIGVICHESLHFFGLPDLYDTTYASAGLGAFSIMASGSWNGTSQSNRDGKCPAHPDAWCKDVLGWITPKTARTGINYIGQSATDKTAFYKFAPSTFDSTEYFLMENRQSAGFDKGLPGTIRGILIYHIDESVTADNDNRYRYMVDIEEADGTANWINDHLATSRYELGRDSDYFRSGNLTVFNDTCVSSPNSKSYDGTLSGIKISGISSSNFNMYFVYGDMEVLDDVSGVLSYPNPARNGSLYITNIPASRQDFSAEIFTMKGNLVRYFSENDIEDVELGSTVFGRIKWDLKNDKGENVAPGVYLVLVKANSSKKTFKAAVIR